MSFLTLLSLCSSSVVTRNSTMAIMIGSMYGKASIYKDGKEVIVTDDNGSAQIPLIITFTDNGTIVGNDAINYLITNPENTIYDIGAFLVDPYRRMAAKYQQGRMFIFILKRMERMFRIL